MSVMIVKAHEAIKLVCTRFLGQHLAPGILVSVSAEKGIHRAVCKTVKYMATTPWRPIMICKKMIHGRLFTILRVITPTLILIKGTDRAHMTSDVTSIAFMLGIG
jgi:hypothetical protein